VLFEWARNPYVLITPSTSTRTYFTRDIVGNPVRGQALWAAIQGYSGLVGAVMAPFLARVLMRAGGGENPGSRFLRFLLALSKAATLVRAGGRGLGP